jgi:hypothetical protein
MMDAFLEGYMEVIEKFTPTYRKLSPAAQPVFDEVFCNSKKKF